VLVNVEARPIIFRLFLLFPQAVSDTTFGEIVGREFNLHPITGQNFDVISPDFSGYMSQDIKAVVQIDSEHGIWQGFSYRAFHFD
jgi:hypothetical protein